MSKKAIAERRLEVVYRDPFDLKPDPRNARTHSPEQIEQLRASIREFGFTNPVLLRPDGMIGAGHGRVEAAKAEKLNVVPTCVVEGLTTDQWRAYVLADNKLALNAGWDDDLLRAELAALAELDVDVSGLGFGEGELAALAAIAGEPAEPEEGPGMNYQEQFAVIVPCATEAEQKTTFGALTAAGYACKVVVT
jgi:ParB-like chromosome segregation protein Spo0J